MVTYIGCTLGMPLYHVRRSSRLFTFFATIVDFHKQKLHSHGMGLMVAYCIGQSKQCRPTWDLVVRM